MSAPLRSSPTVSGHPGISWSIVLHARPAVAVDVAAAAERVAAAWPRDGSAGPPPPVRALEPGIEVAAMVADAANAPYVDGGPLVRIAVVSGPTAEVVVAGHHAALDGLGLVAVVAAVIGSGLGTTARGVASPAPAGALRRIAYPVRRAAEAAFRPPTRIEQRTERPEPAEPAAHGDHLVAADTGRAVTTAGLVAAAADAVRAWNARSGAPARRVMVAVGASARPGAGVTVGRDATWFRVAVPAGATAGTVRQLLTARGPEPAAAASALRAARATGVAGRLERRTGSTLLVSNLGELVPGDAVSEAAFYPSAHGRSGLAVGAVRTGGRTTLTVRARRSGFTTEEARRFLGLVVERVEAFAGSGEY